MPRRTKFWYVIVMTDEGPKFVTSTSGRTAKWIGTERPLELSESMAIDMCKGLTWNGFTAYPVCMPCELDYQPYRYDMGNMKWVDKKEGENK